MHGRQNGRALLAARSLLPVIVIGLLVCRLMDQWVQKNIQQRFMVPGFRLCKHQSRLTSTITPPMQRVGFLKTRRFTLHDMAGPVAHLLACLPICAWISSSMWPLPSSTLPGCSSYIHIILFKFYVAMIDLMFFITSYSLLVCWTWDVSQVHT